MSSVRQKVLRTVRLLPQAVKIGMEPEAAPPPVREEEQPLNEPSPPQEPVKSREDELQEQLADLRNRLRDAEARAEELVRERNFLETEVERVRADCAERERAAEARTRDAEAQACAEGRLRGEAEGREAGHAEGLRVAKVEVEALYLKKLGGLVSFLESIAARLEEDFAELVALNQPRMLRLWFDMLRRMLKREVELKPDAVLQVLSDVLSRLSDKNSVVIYASPEDVGLLQDNLDKEFEDVLRGVRHLELKADTNVDRGSCIVETGLGVYDARWRTQIGQIDSTLDKLFQKLGKVTKRPSARKKGVAAEPASETGRRRKAATKGAKDSRERVGAVSEAPAPSVSEDA